MSATLGSQGVTAMILWTLEESWWLRIFSKMLLRSRKVLRNSSCTPPSRLGSFLRLMNYPII
jgi:hypothetical protein